jgi:hypothetical protein
MQFEKTNQPTIMNTFTEKVGIVNEVISYMQNPGNQATLTAKNFDPAPHIARLQAELKTVTDLAPQQKALEVQHIKATSDLQTATYGAYNDASGVIDAMIGLLGKGSTEAQKLQTIRSKVRKHSAANPPVPTPAAKA